MSLLGFTISLWSLESIYARSTWENLASSLIAHINLAQNLQITSNDDLYESSWKRAHILISCLLSMLLVFQLFSYLLRVWILTLCASSNHPALMTLGEISFKPPIPHQQKATTKKKKMLKFDLFSFMESMLSTTLSNLLKRALGVVRNEQHRTGNLLLKNANRVSDVPGILIISMNEVSLCSARSSCAIWLAFLLIWEIYS